MKFVQLPLRSLLAAASLLAAGTPALAAPATTAPAAHAAKPPRRAHPRKHTTTHARASGRHRGRHVGGAAAAPAAVRYTTPRGSAALAGDLGVMLGSRVRSGAWGAIVVSLTRGDTLFKHDADAKLQPASTMKMFTAALALDRFGPTYQFSTDVLRDGSVDASGTLHGNLYLRGDGDPALSNRFLQGTPDAPMALLAQYVQQAGIKHVAGDVIGDATGFEDKRIPDGWNPRNLGAAYSAPVSALSLNENVVWIAVYPDGHVALEPATTAIPVHANVRVTRGGTGGQVTSFYSHDGSVTVRGWIGSRSLPRRYELVVNDPAPFAAGALRAALAAKGVIVDGATRLGSTPKGADRVASLQSPPLARMVSAMNRESINHYAELLFRDAARGTDRSALGSAANGYALLKQFLGKQVGASPDAVFAVDGSGLSTLDRVTPRAMVQLLSYAHHATWGPAFHASLPVAGESELLRNRMKYTPAQGNLHAKTGTTDHVISLGGFVTAADGEVLAFSFIYNGTDRWNAKSTIDTMGATLAGFARD